MPDMPELETNELIKGSKNKEQDTNSIKESKNYAEFDSLKQEENMQQQKLAEEEENTKRGFFARILMGISRAFTRQNKKPNKLDIEEIIQDEINEDIENEINEKERTQEQQQANKQEKEEIKDFDVFAKKENKQQENKLEEKQKEKKSFFQKIFSPKQKDTVKDEGKKEETLITPLSVNSEAIVVHNPKVQEISQSQELVATPIPDTIVKIQNRINKMFKLDVFDDIDNFIAGLNKKSEEAKQKENFSKNETDKAYFIEPLEMKKIATIFAYEDRLNTANKDNVMNTCIQYLSNGGIDIDSANSTIMMSYTVTNNKAVQQSITKAVMDSFANLQMSNTMIIESLASSVLPAVMDKGGPLATFAEKVIIGANPQDLLENDIDLSMLKKTQIYRKNPDIHRVVNYTSLDSDGPIIEEVGSKPLNNNGPIIEEIESKPILQPTQQTIFPQIKDIDDSKPLNNNGPIIEEVGSKPLNNNGPIIEEIESKPILQPIQQTVFPQIKDIEPQKKPEILNEPLEISDDVVQSANKGKDMQAISVAQTGEKAKESDSKGIQSTQKQKNNGMTM